LVVSLATAPCGSRISAAPRVAERVGRWGLSQFLCPPLQGSTRSAIPPLASLDLLYPRCLPASPPAPFWSTFSQLIWMAAAYCDRAHSRSQKAAYSHPINSCCLPSPSCGSFHRDRHKTSRCPMRNALLPPAGLASSSMAPAPGSPRVLYANLDTIVSMAVLECFLVLQAPMSLIRAQHRSKNAWSVPKELTRSGTPVCV